MCGGGGREGCQGVCQGTLEIVHNMRNSLKQVKVFIVDHTTKWYLQAQNLRDSSLSVTFRE